MAVGVEAQWDLRSRASEFGRRCSHHDRCCRVRWMSRERQPKSAWHANTRHVTASWLCAERHGVATQRRPSSLDDRWTEIMLLRQPAEPLAAACVHCLLCSTAPPPGFIRPLSMTCLLAVVLQLVWIILNVILNVNSFTLITPSNGRLSCLRFRFFFAWINRHVTNWFRIVFVLYFINQSAKFYGEIFGTHLYLWRIG